MPKYLIMLTLFTITALYGCEKRQSYTCTCYVTDAATGVKTPLDGGKLEVITTESKVEEECTKQDARMEEFKHLKEGTADCQYDK